MRQSIVIGLQNLETIQKIIWHDLNYAKNETKAESGAVGAR